MCERVNGWRELTAARRDAAQLEASLILADVVAGLRAGASVAHAWEQALGAGVRDERAYGEKAYGDAAATRSAEPMGAADGVPAAIWIHPALCDVAASIAAACRVTHQLGIAQADVLDTLIDTLDDAHDAALARRVARAGPTMTARLLATLPLLGFLGSWLVGFNPLVVVTDAAIGSLSAVVGFGLWVLGVVWARRIIARAERETRERVEPIVTVTLLAASIRAGCAVSRAFEAVGLACDEDDLVRVARVLRLGGEVEEIEGEARASVAADIVRALRPTWSMGASPMTALGILARHMRRQRSAMARAEAGRLAVRLVLPLGLCLLPAFVCLAIVPVVIQLSSW